MSAAKKTPQVAIAAEEMLVGYDQGTVCGELNFSVEPGDVLALIGANGTGKSTVLKALLGALEPAEGKVYLLGSPVDDRELTFRRDVSSVMDEDAFFPSLTVREHLILMAKGHGLPDPEAAVNAEISAFGLIDREDALPSELSSGQRRRMLLASAFIRPFRVLVLDEPEQRLDPATRLALADRLRGIAADGAAIVMATHDAELLSGCADWAIVIDDEPYALTVEEAVAHLQS
ncbi:ABC transporter ATP-binding protein [Saxibacter everestensis]|uniref:ABC transporter ATP-binding protein n=1 Tax=Saxibacter everestensis TaxID=2909229 RepID=A0ABY8QXZ9_9MICO|nr:ABC transporter ATP-binding protein [Brevibacteriaceae bacterium ZFBP1038]